MPAGLLRTAGAPTRALRLSLSFLLSAAACAPRSAVVLDSPVLNPTGCYLVVYDRPGLTGTREVWSGPARWSTLTRSPNEMNWKNRIRSFATGRLATATLYAAERFAGTAWQFGPGMDQRELGPGLEGQIQSIEISCR